MARGLVPFRWLTLAWAWLGLVPERTHLERLWLALVLLGAATAVTVLTTIVAGRDPHPFRRRKLLVAEVTVAAALLLLEPLVYDGGRSQSLAWAWPAAGILAVAAALGLGWGLLAGGGLALASWAGESILRDEVQWSTSTASKTALFLLPAIAGALVANVLREAEREISTVRAREEMGRVLHDGVLQTLAVVQRRTDDEELRELARHQERDLRAYLYGQTRADESLVVRLRTTVDQVARRHGVAVACTLADDLPDPPREVTDALAGAVGEAVTNAAKHSRAGRISVYAEPSGADGVYCSVHDDGVGFDRTATPAGLGIARSIEARLAEVGGRVEIRSAPGRGTDVQLWSP